MFFFQPELISLTSFCSKIYCNIYTMYCIYRHLLSLHILILQLDYEIFQGTSKVNRLMCFAQIWEICSHYFFKYFFPALNTQTHTHIHRGLLSPSGVLMTHMLSLLLYISTSEAMFIFLIYFLSQFRLGDSY